MSKIQISWILEMIQRVVFALNVTDHGSISQPYTWSLKYSKKWYLKKQQGNGPHHTQQWHEEKIYAYIDI